MEYSKGRPQILQCGFVIKLSLEKQEGHKVSVLLSIVPQMGHLGGIKISNSFRNTVNITQKNWRARRDSNSQPSDP